jgi:hypothetical protein
MAQEAMGGGKGGDKAIIPFARIVVIKYGTEYPLPSLLDHPNSMSCSRAEV